MTNDDLCYLSAVHALKLFKKRKLSPVELTKALIARAEKVNPKINCLADRYHEEALAQARASEARYMKRGAKTAPLDGVPLAVKDAQRLKGKRTTQGSLIFKDWVDDHSDPMIERLQKAGAVILARTTTPEFCLPESPPRACGASRAIHGTPNGVRVDHRADRAQPLRQGSQRWRRAPTSAVRSAFRRRPAGWWDTSRHTDEIQTGRPPTSTASTTADR